MYKGVGDKASSEKKKGRVCFFLLLHLCELIGNYRLLES